MNRKKIAVFNFSHDHWQQTTLLDYTLQELELGNSVTWIDGSKLDQPTNKHRISTKIIYNFAKLFGIYKILYKIKQENLNFSHLELQTLQNKKSNDPIPFNETIANELLITELRDSSPCSIHNKEILESIKTAYVKNYLNCLQYLEDQKYDQVVIFNGRFIQERSCWEAAKHVGMQVKFIERFSPQWVDRYMLFDYPVHSINYRAKIMTDFYVESKDNLKDDKAKKWFEDRRNGISQKFTSNQKIEFTQTNIDKIITFFHSSEDELFSTDLGSVYWKNQMDLLRDLISIVENLDDHTLIVRLHPNLSNKSKYEIHRWKLFSIEKTSAKIKFLSPDNPINSYSLINASQKIITFGSTIGVEAAHMNRLSILAGSAFHQTMGITLNVTNLNQLENAVKTADIANHITDSYKNSLVYGYFQSMGGTKLKYLVSNKKTPSQDGDFNYKGISFKKPRIVSLVFHMENWIYGTKQNKCNASCTIY